ncbi:hypothetical protein OC845_001119 [Tilletia horrida]|nr:hypothetical protein OC845_001119 [Tilletia horrida]
MPASASSPVVKLSQGVITGYLNKTSSVETFLGIPFALPPVRFAKPVAVPKHYGNVKATKFGPICTQNATDTFDAGSEDCLTVNIFRPRKTSAKAKLPVVVYIYGGSFNAGGAFPYTGNSLVPRSVSAGKPIILVTLNYRVGIYGFLGGDSFYEQVKKGNATLNAAYWDQRLAQQWVVKNIESFGGDPKKITIWGQSAGAFGVGAHLTFKDNLNATNRPFRAAIMNSGTPQFPTTLPPTHPRLTDTYNKVLNLTSCTSNSSAQALACLRSVNASILAAANKVIVTDPGLIVGFLLTTPILDGNFFPASPNELLRTGRFADVPILTGNMNDEGTIFAPTTIGGSQNFTLVESAIFGANTTQSATAASVLTTIPKLYPNRLPLGSPYLQQGNRVSQGVTNGSDPFYFQPSDNQYKRLSSLFGDWAFFANRRFMLANVASGGRKSRAWGYIVRQLDYGYELKKGCAHGTELPYLFGNTGTGAFGSPRLYEPLAKRMSHAWISFIADLDPRTIDGLHWPPYNNATARVLYQFKGLNNTVVPDDFRSQQMAFLTSPDAVKTFSS